MNTSNMWVTHRERNRTKLCDPPSSVKTPKASGETAHKSSGKPGRGRPSSRWSDWVWHKPRAWAATESLPDPTTPHQVGHWARGAAGGGDQNWGRARREAPPAAPSGLGGVCPTWAGADAGISGGGLASSSGPGPARVNPQQAGSPPPAHPPPPSAAGPERGFEGRLSGCPLGYRPRLLAAAAAVAAVTAAAGRPQPLLLCQPLLLLLPPPPPPRPHRSHRRCGDYCSAR